MVGNGGFGVVLVDLLFLLLEEKLFIVGVECGLYVVFGFVVGIFEDRGDV